MADIIGLYCAKDNDNNGDYLCAPEPGLFTGYIAIRKGRTYAKADLADAATAFATLQSDLYNPVKALRTYIFKDAADMVANYTAATTESSTYGKVHPLLDQMINFVFKFWQKGKCWYKNALSFNKKSSEFNYIFLSFKTGDVVFHDLGDGTVTGFEMSGNLVDADTAPTGTANSFQNHTLWFEDYQNDYGKEFAMIKIDPRMLKRLSGLNDIYMKDITSTISPEPPVGTYYVQILQACSNTDVAAQYISLFEGTTQSAPYISTNNTTGTVIPISAATYHPESESVAIAFTLTGGPWILGDDVKLSLPATNVLNAYGIIGKEANPTSIILPN